MRRRGPVIDYCLSGINVPVERIPRHNDSFTLAAQPRTDLWRKSPGQDTSTAPALFASLRFPFASAEVTVDAKWALEWDQAGLVIFTGAPPGRIVDCNNQVQDEQPPPYTAPPKWAKVGLELNNNILHASSAVANAEGTDWCLTALPSHLSQRGFLRIRLERIGRALWMYYEDDFTGWRKFRELTGFFCGVEDKFVKVGVYASRPASVTTSYSGRELDEMDRSLVVEFEDLLIF
ncbi:hypothetical protein BT63DRAFT_36479 [Microthyrium microscopicum]|uniref:Uncharacterized protein n=1 Tax=Microthyrium microscopicum TaxID=703497 RepID=A0A6A6UT23_9PEZI|nr:hypothetical protein BT63DRAFT_36479 [Microthyrium microscopicum]